MHEDYSQEELLAFDLPDVDALRASVEAVAEAFQETAGTLTLAGSPGDTVLALNRAANAMVRFAMEHERYWTAAKIVSANPQKAWRANHAQDLARRERGE